MKKIIKIITILLCIILMFSYFSFVFADENNEIMLLSGDDDSSDSFTHASEEPVNAHSNNYKQQDVYLMDDTVTVDYVIDGNLFVLAKSVYINSEIAGDVFIIANEVTLDSDSYVYSNLFVLGKNITLKGGTYDIYACGNTITLDGGSTYRDAKIACNTLNFGGIVGRNLFTTCPNINFTSVDSNNCLIYGDFTYYSNNQIEIPDGVVYGNIDFHEEKIEEESTFDIISEYILDLGIFLAFALIIWLISSWLAPKFLDYTNNYVGKRSLKVIGIGLLTLVTIPIVCLILFLLQLTITFSLFLIAIYILSLIISPTIFTITTNKYICSKLKINKFAPTLGMLIVTAGIFHIITTIPYIGFILSLISIVCGLGVLVSYILPNHFETKKTHEDKTNIIENTNNN